MKRESERSLMSISYAEDSTLSLSCDVCVFFFFSLPAENVVGNARRFVPVRLNDYTLV